MRFLARLFSAVALLALLGTGAWAGPTTIDFDALTPPKYGDLIANVDPTYAGLTWNNMAVVAYDDIAPSGYYNGVVSTPNVALNWFMSDASFSSVDTFDLVSLYLGAAWNNGLQVDITGSLAGSPIYSVTETVDTSGTTQYVLDWTGIDTVTFHTYGGTLNPDLATTGHGTQMVLDNVVLNVKDTRVPEPGTLALLVGACVAGAGVIRRRKG